MSHTRSLVTPLFDGEKVDTSCSSFSAVPTAASIDAHASKLYGEMNDSKSVGLSKHIGSSTLSASDHVTASFPSSLVMPSLYDTAMPTMLPCFGDNPGSSFSAIPSTVSFASQSYEPFKWISDSKIMIGGAEYLKKPDEVCFYRGDDEFKRSFDSRMKKSFEYLPIKKQEHIDDDVIKKSSLSLGAETAIHLAEATSGLTHTAGKFILPGVLPLFSVLTSERAKNDIKSGHSQTASFVCGNAGAIAEAGVAGTLGATVFAGGLEMAGSTYGLGLVPATLFVAAGLVEAEKMGVKAGNLVENACLDIAKALVADKSITSSPRHFPKASLRTKLDGLPNDNRSSQLLMRKY